MRFSNLTIDSIPKAADIVLTRKKRTIIGRLIRHFQTTRSDTTKTIFEHVGMMINGFQLIEALHRVKINELSRQYKKRKYDYLIARRIDLTDSDREFLKRGSLAYHGKRYGYIKLFMHFLDHAVGRICRKDIFFFRKITKSNKYPICSWLVAWVYDTKEIKFNNVTKESCQPDDIADDILLRNHDKYELVFCTMGIYKVILEQIGEDLHHSVKTAMRNSRN